MSDDLARKIADQQLEMQVDALARDAKRLAEAAARIVDDIGRGVPVSGTARRLAQDASELAYAAARLDGMRDIAGLIAKEDA